jgi:hypothetical protein
MSIRDTQARKGGVPLADWEKLIGCYTPPGYHFGKQ